MSSATARPNAIDRDHSENRPIFLGRVALDVRATAIAMSLLCSFWLGVSLAQEDLPAGTAGDDQLRRWTIPERIDPRDYELEIAMVRVVHLATRGPEQTVRISWDDLVPFVTSEQLDRSQRAWFEPDGTSFSDLSYAGVTSYRQIPAGDRRITVRAVGDAEAELVTEASFEAGEYYTLVLAGTESEAGDGANSRVAIRLLHDDAAVPPAGRAGLRIVHEARGVEAIDVWSWRSDVPRAVVPPDGPRGMFAPLVAVLELAEEHLPALSVQVYPDDSLVMLAGPDAFSTQFYGHATLASLPEGEYTAKVTRDGFLEAARGFSLGEGEHLSFEILLEEDPEEEDARLSGPPPPERISPVWTMPMGDFALLRDLSLGAASDYLSLYAPGYSLEARPAGNLEVLARIDGTALEAGKMYTAFVTEGTEADAAWQILLVEDGVWGIYDAVDDPAARNAE